ncbi:hypothetical protein KA005_23770, partial [bacterium]|nr:hypothetical protein [bacterium]
WLLVLHYQVMDSLRKLYTINSDEFIVLNAVRLYTEITRGLYFTVGELRKAFPHMKNDYLQSVIDNLITKGFVHTNLLLWRDDPKRKLQISKKGFEMIDAFHDRFREALLKFEEKVGDIPGHMILKK